MRRSIRITRCASTVSRDAVGERHGERATRSQCGLEREITAESAGKLAADGETKARTTVMDVPTMPHLHERFKHRLVILRGDADAAVVHVELNAMFDTRAGD